MTTVTPWLWFAHDAEEAARFYTSLLPDSAVGAVQRSPADNPSVQAGAVLTVAFTLAGRPYMALNGGTALPYNNSMSLQVLCDSQAEVDRLWEALTADGGAPSRCGWLNDRWGVPWQIIPARMMELLGDPDPARAKRAMEAMLEMTKLDIAKLERAADGA